MQFASPLVTLHRRCSYLKKFEEQLGKSVSGDRDNVRAHPTMSCLLAHWPKRLCRAPRLRSRHSPTPANRRFAGCPQRCRSQRPRGSLRKRLTRQFALVCVYGRVSRRATPPAFATMRRALVCLGFERTVSFVLDCVLRLARAPTPPPAPCRPLNGRVGSTSRHARLTCSRQQAARLHPFLPPPQPSQLSGGVSSGALHRGGGKKKSRPPCSSSLPRRNEARRWLTAPIFSAHAA